MFAHFMVPFAKVLVCSSFQHAGLSDPLAPPQSVRRSPYSESACSRPFFSMMNIFQSFFQEQLVSGFGSLPHPEARDAFEWLHRCVSFWQYYRALRLGLLAELLHLGTVSIHAARESSCGTISTLTIVLNVGVSLGRKCSITDAGVRASVSVSGRQGSAAQGLPLCGLGWWWCTVEFDFLNGWRSLVSHKVVSQPRSCYAASSQRVDSLLEEYLVALDGRDAFCGHLLSHHSPEEQGTGASMCK